MSSFWINALPASRGASPVAGASPAATITASASVASAIYARTVIPASSSIFNRSSSITRLEDDATGSTPSSLSKASRSSRVSFFTSKFLRFKARRTTTGNAFADPTNATHSSGLTQVQQAISNASRDNAYPRNHRAMTAPTRLDTPPSPPLVGLGLVGLEYDSKDGKYRFKDSPRTPSSGSSWTMRTASEVSSESACPSPSTPSSVITSFAPSADDSDPKDGSAEMKSQMENVLRYGVGEMNSADVAGILAVLFPSDEVKDKKEWDQQTFGLSLPKGSSPTLGSDNEDASQESIDSPPVTETTFHSKGQPQASETETSTSMADGSEGMAQFAYMVLSPDTE